MIGYTQNNRGNYKCNYCNHETWKTSTGALKHVEVNHPTELAVDRAKADMQTKINDADYKARMAESRAREAERKLQAQQKPKELERYSAVVYCPNCLSVDSVRIVKGQSIGGGGCFRCGHLGGQLVEHVNVNYGHYHVTEN